MIQTFIHAAKAGAARPSAARVTLAIALGVLLFKSWRACSRTRRQRLAQHSAAAPEALQTWEGEGGAPSPAAGQADREPGRRKGNSATGTA